MFLGFQINNKIAPATLRRGAEPLTFREIFRASLVWKYVIKFKIKSFYQVSYPLVSGRSVVQFLYFFLLQIAKVRFFFEKSNFYMQNLVIRNS